MLEEASPGCISLCKFLGGKGGLIVQVWWYCGEHGILLLYQDVYGWAILERSDSAGLSTENT